MASKRFLDFMTEWNNAVSTARESNNIEIVSKEHKDGTRTTSEVHTFLFRGRKMKLINSATPKAMPDGYVKLIFSTAIVCVDTKKRYVVPSRNDPYHRRKFVIHILMCLQDSRDYENRRIARKNARNSIDRRVVNEAVLKMAKYSPEQIEIIKSTIEQLISEDSRCGNFVNLLVSHLSLHATSIQNMLHDNSTNPEYEFASQLSLKICREIKRLIDYSYRGVLSNQYMDRYKSELSVNNLQPHRRFIIDTTDNLKAGASTRILRILFSLLKSHYKNVISDYIDDIVVYPNESYESYIGRKKEMQKHNKRFTNNLKKVLQIEEPQSEVSVVSNNQVCDKEIQARTSRVKKEDRMFADDKPIESKPKFKRSRVNTKISAEEMDDTQCDDAPVLASEHAPNIDHGNVEVQVVTDNPFVQLAYVDGAVIWK